MHLLANSYLQFLWFNTGTTYRISIFSNLSYEMKMLDPFTSWRAQKRVKFKHTHTTFSGFFNLCSWQNKTSGFHKAAKLKPVISTKWKWTINVCVSHMWASALFSQSNTVIWLSTGITMWNVQFAYRCCRRFKSSGKLCCHLVKWKWKHQNLCHH